MKNYLKYSILLTLSLLITISLVNAPIGQNPQQRPYESNPTALANFMVGAPISTGKDAMKDGDLTSSGDFFLGAPHIIRPNGDGNYKAWTEFPANAGFLAWYQESPDGDSTYVFTTTASARESSLLEDPPAGASGTIASVTVWINAKRTGTSAGSITPFLRLGSTDQSGTAITTLTTSYASYSRVINRPGGGSWTWADITNLEAGVLFGSGTPRVTQLYVEIAGPTTGFFEFSTFTNTPSATFPIAWVDFKMKYSVPTALVDDTYKIEYTVDPSGTWTDLQAATSNIFDSNGLDAVVPWTNQAEPNDGVWDWTDIGNVRIRVTVNQVGAWDALKMFVSEVWLTIYETAPPTSSTALSIMPPGIYGAGAGIESFFDVYVAGLTPPPGLWGYQTTILFDPTYMQVIDGAYFSYWPFTASYPALVDNVHGAVSIAFSSFLGDDVGFLGTSTPLCRIYFTPVGGGGGGGTQLDMVPSYTDPDTSLVYVTELKPVQAAGYTPTMYDGWVGTQRFLSYTLGMLPPVPPVGTTWHEEYPTYSTPWTLTSWVDNGDGYLSASDQIDMTTSADPGWIYWYHVDVVTTTIHFTFKDPAGPGIAEPDPPAPYETDLPDPTGTRWHMIYPTYCRMFTINSWEDNIADPNGVFDPSDQFDMEFDDETGTTYWAHLDSITTDIIISMKYKEPGVPEFPLGIGLIFAVAPLVAVVYLMRTRKKVTRQ